MIEERLKKTTIYTAIFAVLSLVVMFYRAGTKNIMIVEATKEQAEVVDLENAYKLEIMEPSADKGKGTLVIPLEQGVGSDNITFEERHSEHQFILYVSGKDPNFYETNSAISDLKLITDANWIRTDENGGVCLTFNLDGLYENETSLGDKEVVVTFNSPADLYENIVVIDPVDDAGLSLIPYIKKNMDKAENIRVYYTRQSGGDTEEKAATALIDDSAADFYIQVGADADDEGTSGVKTYYNDRYFIREFGNIELADRLEWNLAVNAGVMARGLSVVDHENSRIMNSRIPSAYVTIGNTKNADDELLMTKDDYLEKCALGICNGITEAFSVVNPQEEVEETDALQGIINGN